MLSSFVQSDNFPGYMSSTLSFITTVFPLFHDIAIEYSAGPPSTTLSVQAERFSSAMFSTIRCINCTVRSKRAEAWFKTNMQAATRAIFHWAQVVHRDVSDMDRPVQVLFDHP